MAHGVSAGRDNRDQRKTQAMKITNEITIQASAQKVWSVLAGDFAGIQRWASSVVASEPLEDAPLPGAPTAGRLCELTPNGRDGLYVVERIQSWSDADRTLSFVVEPTNAPTAMPVAGNRVELAVRDNGDDTSTVTWTSEPTLKTHGYLLYPVLRAGLRKSFGDLLAQLKTFVEGQRAAA